MEAGTDDVLGYDLILEHAALPRTSAFSSVAYRDTAVAKAGWEQRSQMRKGVRRVARQTERRWWPR